MKELLDRFPSPWTVEDRGYLYTVRAGNGAEVVSVEDTALAQMIASCPELYGMREMLQEAFDTPWVGTDNQHLMDVLNVKRRMAILLGIEVV